MDQHCGDDETSQALRIHELLTQALDIQRGTEAAFDIHRLLIKALDIQKETEAALCIR